MPVGAVFDYEPHPGMAHAALPRFDAAKGGFTGHGRIWLKGSVTCTSASIDASGETVDLPPPYYTAIVEAPAGITSVVFRAGAMAVHSVAVVVPDAAELNTPGTPFSALFFGDFQPFVVRDGEVRVNRGTKTGDARGTLLAIRSMFRAAAVGALVSFPRPAFACGVGDQIYVEGDYHAWDACGHLHPMSAWTVEAQPRPRVGLADLPRFLDVCYRANWSFSALDRAFRACPTLMTWDDHDIRDGWGSQGDEHVWRDSYFRTFRAAYLDHQFRRGPRPWSEELAAIDAPLWQSFAIHGVPVFVLDLRSCRDVAVPRVIGDEQWRALRQWFQALDAERCRHYVLVSSVPVFYRVAERASIAATFSEEVRDDLIDTWTSAQNEPEWQQLVAEIAGAGARGLRGLIVSGDYHVNALCRITASRSDGGRYPIAYELMASGLANDAYGDWKQKMAREGWFMETPIEVDGGSLFTDFSFADPCPSFGGLEFSGSDVVAHLFQASADGCFQQRVPLDWEDASALWSTLVAQSRHRVDPTHLPR